MNAATIIGILAVLSLAGGARRSQSTKESRVPKPGKKKDPARAAKIREVYKARRDAFLKERFGVSDEELAAAAPILDATDANLYAIDAAEKGKSAGESVIKKAGKALFG